jgi:hypothetical protein
VARSSCRLFFREQRHLDLAGDGRERRAHFVRGVRHEGPLEAEGFFQPVEHRLKVRASWAISSWPLPSSTRSSSREAEMESYPADDAGHGLEGFAGEEPARQEHQARCQQPARRKDEGQVALLAEPVLVHSRGKHHQPVGPVGKQHPHDFPVAPPELHFAPQPYLVEGRLVDRQVVGAAFVHELVAGVVDDDLLAVDTVIWLRSSSLNSSGLMVARPNRSLASWRLPCAAVPGTPGPVPFGKEVDHPAEHAQQRRHHPVNSSVRRVRMVMAIIFL